MKHYWTGEEMKTRKPFLERWKAGIAMVTPLQASMAQQKSNYIMIIGLICGIIATAFKLKDFWWIEVILVAGLFNQIYMTIATAQKIKLLRNIEKGGV